MERKVKASEGKESEGMARYGIENEGNSRQGK
jgi:hypothetical protein